MKKIILFFLFYSGFISAQSIVRGVVTFNDGTQKKPLSGVEIFWKDSSTGTTSGSDGKFSITYNTSNKKLIFKYLGFKTQTIEVLQPKNFISISLEEDARELDAVELYQKRKPTQKLTYSIANLTQINSGELLKAACCNLSESFETNSSVDVSVSDAVSGTKQIKMLGLSSPYLLMTREGIPLFRGAPQNYGLTFIPGTWIESIQIGKGAGSVINGYESISGQINTELVKPMLDKPLFFNAFTSGNGRMELNAHFNQKISPNWYTGIYLHGDMNRTRNDNNHDGFLDIPIGHQINLMNRWQYLNAKRRWTSNLLFHFLSDERFSGQTQFQPDNPQHLWGSRRNIRQFNTMAKAGYIWEDLPFQSIGFQADYNYYQQQSQAGNNRYDALQHRGFVNVIFSSIIDNTNHKFTTGMSSSFDTWAEDITLQSFSNKYQRTDFNWGAYFEYTFNGSETIHFTSGIRWDYHNRLGSFFTPRLHLKITPWKNGIVRLSAGRGKRIVPLFAEQQKVFASGRKLLLPSPLPQTNFAGETAWNYGISWNQKFHVFPGDGAFSIDFYRTDFVQQVVVDWERFGAISFYELEGKSFANSLQIEYNQDFFSYLDMKLAYKFYDVQTDFHSGRKQPILQPKHRLMANLSYESQLKNQRQWRIDYTFNWTGKQRLPQTPQYPNGSFSPSYSLSNFQITRVFSKKFELYIGGENIFHYRQKEAILGADHPFGTDFDTGLIYAPVLGRMLYGGLRLSI